MGKAGRVRASSATDKPKAAKKQKKEEEQEVPPAPADEWGLDALFEEGGEEEESAGESDEGHQEPSAGSREMVNGIRAIFCSICKVKSTDEVGTSFSYLDCSLPRTCTSRPRP
jgi:hypothetical protein